MYLMRDSGAGPSYARRQTLSFPFYSCSSDIYFCSRYICYNIFGAAVLACCIPCSLDLSIVYLITVSVEPESTEIRIRECDDLVFVLTTDGTYTEPYQVSVECGRSPGSEGGKPALSNIKRHD